MAESDRSIIDKVFVLLGLISTIVLVVISGLAWYGYHFATTQVKNELSEQKIYFPAANSANFTAAEYPTLQKYAGQLVDNGPKAKAYANDYIGHHLEKIAGGKTYSEVSAEAKADPTNTTLATQKATLFQGETLRGLLLGDGYAYWTFGMMALYTSFAALVGAVVMAVLVLLGMAHLRRIKK